MIFVTVGHQMPFDRLVRAVDEWAGRHPNVQVFAQIGKTSFRPRNMEWASALEPCDYTARMQRAEQVVAHAGMGTILTCLSMGRPVLVLPRRAALRETRNDHQLATARHLSKVTGIHVATDEAELAASLDKLDVIAAAERVAPHASTSLIDAIQGFIVGSG